MNGYGYEFYFNIDGRVLTLPITPAELDIKIGTNNKVVTLINEGDINILKSPSLIEINFDARFPMRKYPYSREVLPFDEYYAIFTDVMVQKKPVVFSVVRTTPGGKGTWGTTRKVTIELFETKESADEGDDVIVTFELKEYKDYSVKFVKSPTANSNPTTTSTSQEAREDNSKSDQTKTHDVKDGDCLWNIAKLFYENGALWKKIYDANKTVIEETANKYRNGKGSSNGHYIYAGTKLVIPPK